MAKVYINGRFLTQNLTGVQRYAREVVMAIDVLNPEIEVILLVPNKGLKDVPVFKNIKIKKAGFFSGHLWEQFDLPRLSNDGLLLCLGNLAPVISLLTGKVVTTVHDLSFRYFPASYSRSFRLIYNFVIPMVMRFASHIITVSETEKTSMSKCFPYAKPRLTAIANGGLSPKDKKNINVLTEREPFVLYVGSLNRHKNFQGIIEAAKILADSNIEFKLAGNFSAVFNSGESYEVSSNIKFLNRVDDEELIKLYCSAACFIFPSFFEGSGLPPVEAMACGCPVVVSDIPVLRERCGDAALYCNPYQPEDIADKILQVLNNKELRQDLIAKGYDKASEYTWENCARQVLEIILAEVKNN